MHALCVPVSVLLDSGTLSDCAGALGCHCRVQEEVLDPAKMGNDEVLVRVLAAPINHADWNIMQGHYGTLPKLPAFVGLEGAAEVEAVGAGVTSLKPSDRVMFADASLGEELFFCRVPVHTPHTLFSFGLPSCWC